MDVNARRPTPALLQLASFNVRSTRSVSKLVSRLYMLADASSTAVVFVDLSLSLSLSLSYSNWDHFTTAIVLSIKLADNWVPFIDFASGSLLDGN